MLARVRYFLGLGWVDRRRLNAYSIILLIASLPSFIHFYAQAMGPIGSDFLAFWSAGKLVVAGRAASVYDLAATQAMQATLGRQDVFAFVNPPPFLFVATPLGLMQYWLGWISWIAVTYLFWLFMTRRAEPGMAWQVAAFPGALVAAWHAQTGLLTSGLQAGAVTQASRRPLIAGLWVGALVVKPHLAVLFPVAFVAGRHWRMFAGAVLSMTVLLLLAALVFGSATMTAYPDSWAVSRRILDTGSADFFLRQATIYAMVRILAGAKAAVVAQGVASATVALIVWRVWRRPGAMEGKMACLLAATPLATPYLFNYDLPFLVIPICWLARRTAGHSEGWMRPVISMLYLAPLLGRALAVPLGINLTPGLVVVLLACVLRRLAIDEARPWRLEAQA